VKSISSWSKVAREMIKALSKLGVETNIYERKGFLYEEAFDLGELSGKINNEFSGDLVFTFEHPKNYPRLPAGKRKMGFLVYEFTSLPGEWVENVNEYLDLVFVPSRFTAEVFLNSGVEKGKLRILRYGINPEYYRPSFVKNEKLTFLCVGSPQKREAADLALESFARAFPDKADVKLILKLSYNTAGPKSFEISGFAGMLEKYSRKLGDRLEIVKKRLSEKEMGELYGKSDVYFSLSRAESFGLPFLEALACGKPSVCLDYSGQRDFLDGENAYFAPYGMAETSGEEYERTARKQYIARPDTAGAAEILKKVHAERGNLKRPVLKEGLEHYYWENIAREFLQMI